MTSSAVPRENTEMVKGRKRQIEWVWRKRDVEAGSGRIRGAAAAAPPYLLCTFCYFELLGRAQIGLHFIAISVCGGRMKRHK